MKNICFTLLFFTSLILYSQSRFSEGYQDGYKDGYCYNNKIGCIPPVPPIAPIPKTDESLDNYKDGYNRGFIDGKEASNDSNSIGRGRYQTTSPEYIDDIIYQPPVELMTKILDQKKRDLQETSEVRAEQFNTYYQSALSSFFSKKYYNVIDECNKALKTYYYNGDIYAMLGISYYEIGEYEPALANLNKASQISTNFTEVHKYISMTKQAIKAQKDEKKRDFKNFTKRRNFIFGIKGGVLNNENITSPLLGAFFQGSRSMKFAMLAEVMYFQNQEQYYYSYNDDKKDGIIQINLLLKHKLVKRLEVLYGGGFNTNVTNQSDMFATAAGGLQFSITHQFFIDGRYNYAFTNYIPENSFMLSLGFNF